MTVTYRSTKGSALTHAEMDENLRDLDYFTPTHTGAITTRTKNTKLSETWVSVKDFGTTVTAWQAAIDYVASRGGGVVFFPAGNYALTSTGLTIASQNNVWLEGENANSTSLIIGGNSVTAITVSGTSARCAIRNMWIGSFAARTGCTAIKVTGTSSAAPVSELIIENVKIQNINTGLDIDDCHQSNFHRLRFVHSIASAFSGVGMHLKGAITVNVNNVDFVATTGTFGSDNVRVDKDCDTVTLTNINISGGTTGYGIRFLNDGGTTGPRLTRAVNCYVEETSDSGFHVSAARDVRLQGCHAAVNGGHGFEVTGGDSVVMSDCLSFQNDKHGFVISGGTGTGIIGCTSTCNSQDTDNTYDGISIGANVTHCRLMGNRSGEFILTVTNDQRYGIDINGTGTDYIIAIGNDTQGNQTGGLNNGSGGSNNAVDNNV